ncbi:hypothetical protein ABK040_010367 [Willaertia magna]
MTKFQIPEANNRLACFLLFLLFGLETLSFITCQNILNNVIIKDVSGNGLNSYPLQIGRVFMKGEIKTAPGVLFNGTQLNSQAQVTVRYDDGSVRFATVSTILPTFTRNAMGELVFFPYSSMPAKDESCTINEIFKQFPNMDIKLTVSGNNTISSVSAKDMINKGYYQWITQGPIRCELLVVDHITRAADFGLYGPKSLRPIFYFNFWRTIGTVSVRTVLENSNLDTLQDVAYNVTISHGVTNPTILYSKDSISHWFGTRWTRVFWFGNSIPEPKVNIDYNVTYLAMTNMFPNYLANNTMTEARISSYYNNWLKKAKGIFDAGLWQIYQPTTGMREDIGPMPAWKSAWVVMGDWRFREISLVSADLAGSWSAFFREVDSSLYFDREKNISAIGKPISLNAHPKLWFPDNAGKYVGSLNVPRLANPGWVFDGAHQPDPFSVAYMLTGDHYYLESLQLWVALGVMRYPAGQYGRGKDGYAGITDQVRGNAWTVRNRAYAAILSPDGSPEKRYFLQAMDDAIAYWEGQRNVTAGSQLLNHPNRLWAQQNTAFQWSPLRFWTRDTNTKQAAIWQESFMLIILGMLRDMGFNTEPLLKEYHKVLTSQFNAPGYDISGFNTGNFYAVAATSAASFLTNYKNGPELWEFLKSNVFDKFDYSTSYPRSFIIYPRSFLSPEFPTTSIPPSESKSGTSSSVVGELSLFTILIILLLQFI